MTTETIGGQQAKRRMSAAAACAGRADPTNDDFQATAEVAGTASTQLQPLPGRNLPYRSDTLPKERIIVRYYIAIS